jgi:hypothetical protein
MMSPAAPWTANRQMAPRSERRAPAGDPDLEKQSVSQQIWASQEEDLTRRVTHLENLIRRSVELKAIDVPAVKREDFIIRGDEIIQCSEIEAVLSSHRSVKECAVFALSDDRLGEVVGAAALIQGPLSSAELEAHAASNLPKFKVPLKEHIFLFTEELPKGATGKIDKKELKRRIMHDWHDPVYGAPFMRLHQGQYDHQAGQNPDKRTAGYWMLYDKERAQATLDYEEACRVMQWRMRHPVTMALAGDYKYLKHELCLDDGDEYGLYRRYY